ncbi:MAG: ATP-binding protein [Planctomycetota bacterium]|jgi:PAS domain S-box-containing protein
MNIARKLILSSIGIASLVAIVGVIAVKYNTEMVMDVDKILLSNSREAKATSEITNQIQRINSNLGDLFSNDDITTLKSKKLIITIKSNISKLQQLLIIWEHALKIGIEFAKDDEKIRKQDELKIFNKAQVRINKCVEIANANIKLWEEKGIGSAANFYNEKVEPTLNGTRIMASELERNTRRLILAQTKQVRKTAKKNVWGSIIITVLSLVAVLTIRFFINKKISIPITKLTQAADEIQRGQLKKKIDIDSNDEMGQLARSLNDIAKIMSPSNTFSTQKEQKTRTQSNTDAGKTKQDNVGHLETKSPLHRHVKQLNCLYQLSRLVEEPETSLKEIFQGTANLVCNAYQEPDTIRARITFDGINYKTENFEKSELSQHAQIKMQGKKTGVIEVYYIGEKPENGQSPFLDEERDLLDAIAERLGSLAQRKQSEEKVALFRNLIERSNDCIFVIEPKWGRIIDVNERACDSLGYKKQELLTMTLKDIDESIADDAEWHTRTDELSDKGDIIHQSQHRKKDGSNFFVETSFKLVSQEKQDHIIAVARDITERKQAEQRQAEFIRELRTINRKVESINQELKDFAYIISHDLKAPLRGIKTLADWLAKDYADKLDDNGKEQLNLLISRVDRMHNLIEGVLTYSRVGRVEEDKLQVDLNELMHEITDMVAPPENITIIVDENLPILECEKTRITQVFENLLSNAIKYMDKPQGQINISCDDNDDEWQFCVSDNGPGIEEKYFEKIFRIFQTLTPRDVFESTGIGLTVIKKIVELHGGKIWVESTIGQGSKFFFTLPKSGKDIKNAELEANIAC